MEFLDNFIALLSSQLNSTGNMMYIWTCHKQIPLCHSVSLDRCPGQWIEESSLSLIREAIEAIRKKDGINNQLEQSYSYPHSEKEHSENSFGRFVCNPWKQRNISLDHCKEDCLRNKYCTTVKYRPPATAASGKHHLSVCSLVDINSQFPSNKR